MRYFLSITYSSIILTNMVMHGPVWTMVTSFRLELLVTVVQSQSQLLEQISTQVGIRPTYHTFPTLFNFSARTETGVLSSLHLVHKRVRVQIPFVLVQLIPPRTFHPSVFLESAVESDVLVADSDSGLDDSPSLGCETGGKNSEVRNISGASYGKRVLRGVLVTEESVDLINLLNRLDNDPSLV
uniref:Uncharacterized protein n=2 Tax=Cacopsylla melanoneura TaxID=428564 RepID=A0A8D8SME8_9HEMI